MAGKRNRSGPPGNLNSARYPWRVFWRRRALKREDRWIIPVLEDYGAQLISDKGGSESVTSAELRMIEIAQTARGASMLILAETARSGFTCSVNGTWDLAPGSKELSRFLGLELQALRVIGLERRTKEIDLAQQLENLRQGDGNDGEVG